MLTDQTPCATGCTFCCECPDADLRPHCVRDHSNGRYEELFKDIYPDTPDTLTDASEPVAAVRRNKRPDKVLDAKPKAKIAKTAVAAVNPESEAEDTLTDACEAEGKDRKAKPNAKTTYSPFEDTLGALPHGATDEERGLNEKRLEAKRDVVQEAIDNPATLTESMRDAKKRLRWLNREIAK